MSDEDVRAVAMRAYWHGDPADVSVNAICKMAGVSKPSLYRAFGSEDGLTLAALESYRDEILSDVFTILQCGLDIRETLDALIAFACDDPRMAKGCLYYKMRISRHRLGPKTRARLEEIEAAGTAGYEAFLQARRDMGEGASALPVAVAARYLGEQIGLGFAQRAAGEDPARIREMLSLALSVLV